MEHDCQTSEFVKRIDQCVEMRVQEKWLKANAQIRDCDARCEADWEARKANTRLCSVMPHWFVGQCRANKVDPDSILTTSFEDNEVLWQIFRNM